MGKNPPAANREGGRKGDRPMETRTILVSACVLGENCKYNGGNNFCPAAAELLHGCEILTLCPEMLAGMGCPRTPIEIVDGVLMDRQGRNVDRAMRDAVARAMEIVQESKICLAVLQSRSPTCGVNQVYDGTFTGRLISGSGLFAQALKEAGYPVLDVEDLAQYSREDWEAYLQKEVAAP